tara:strand:+ start:1329 stop:1571 length:243 start_codon:yes stop_codon:yes gene_type:complete
VEGTLDELRALFGDAKRAAATTTKAVKETKKVAKTTKRKLSEWQRYIRNKSNHIKFKRGDRKGRLDLKAMSRAFKRSRKK